MTRRDSWRNDPIQWSVEPGSIWRNTEDGRYFKLLSKAGFVGMQLIVYCPYPENPDNVMYCENADTWHTEYECVRGAGEKES